MDAKSERQQERRVLTGNGAAAYAVRLCKPDVICAYPITPQTELIETLYRFQADGSVGAEMVEVEGEHSAMSVLIGVTSVGGRAFSATSAQGLFFMFEPYIFAALQRLPIVMVNVNREAMSPTTVASSEQDIMLVKDTGWIQLHAESCQEILDTIIMAYRLAEDPQVMVPVTVSYDGYYLSYFSEAVDIPPQEAVDEFLPRREMSPKLDPQTRMTLAPFGDPLVPEYRYKHLAALQRSKGKLEEIDGEFQQALGRGYGGQIEEYRCGDADIVLVTMGSCTGTARVVVDRKRDEGLKVGLVKIRMFRPFPRERLLGALQAKKAIGVIDRNVCFGWNCGHLMVELKAALNGMEPQPLLLNFIGGLAGADITLQHIGGIIDTVHSATQGRHCEEVAFLDVA